MAVASWPCPDDRLHRHPAADGLHGEPAGDRGPPHVAGLRCGAPPGAQPCSASGAGTAAGGTGCHQPGWGDLKRRVRSLTCSGPLLAVPPADGAWTECWRSWPRASRPGPLNRSVTERLVSADVAPYRSAPPRGASWLIFFVLGGKQLQLVQIESCSEGSCPVFCSLDRRSRLTDAIEQGAADRRKLATEGGDSGPEVGFVGSHGKDVHRSSAGRFRNELVGDWCLWVVSSPADATSVGGWMRWSTEAGRC